MSLYFITGGSATGKSTITLELRKKGYAAYDTDDDALARWQHIETSYIHPKSSVKPAQRTPDFLKMHSWNVPREFIEKIAAENQGNIAFICGVANNIDQLQDLFSHTFALVIDEKTVRHRIATRTNNNWGKQPHELEQTLKANKKALETYNKLGYTIIDASQPLESVVEDIVRSVKS